MNNKKLKTKQKNNNNNKYIYINFYIYIYKTFFINNNDDNNNNNNNNNELICRALLSHRQASSRRFTECSAGTGKVNFLKTRGSVYPSACSSFPLVLNAQSIAKDHLRAVLL